MNAVMRHVWLVARHHRFGRGHSGDICGTFRLVVRVLRLYPGRHSHEIVVKESVQGLSHGGAIRTVVGMEASASNERLDFALAYFDGKESHPLRRRSRSHRMRTADDERDGSFVAGDNSTVPGSRSISAPARGGEFGFSLRAENIKIVLRWESHRMTLPPEWAIGLEAWPDARANRRLSAMASWTQSSGWPSGSLESHLRET